MTTHAVTSANAALDAGVPATATSAVTVDLAAISNGLRVGVVVPVHQGEAMLQDCAAALLRGNELARLVLVDDASPDASLAVATRIAADSQGRARVLALGRNLGFAGAVNRGVAALLADEPSLDVLVLANQDCVVRPGWSAALCGALREEGVGLAGAVLLEADGCTVQHAGARVMPNGLTEHLGRGLSEGDLPRVGCVDYACGALVAMHAATWRRFGPFDEGYAPAYYEEVDFCRRLRAAGLSVAIATACRAVHQEASTSGAGSREYLRRYHRSRMRFVVRGLWPTQGFASWARAEAAWLLGLRRWHDVAPVLAAYARIPWLLAERMRPREVLR